MLRKINNIDDDVIKVSLTKRILKKNISQSDLIEKKNALRTKFNRLD